jgi:hypothetical protein
MILVASANPLAEACAEYLSKIGGRLYKLAYPIVDCLNNEELGRLTGAARSKGITTLLIDYTTGESDILGSWKGFLIAGILNTSEPHREVFFLANRREVSSGIAPCHSRLLWMKPVTADGEAIRTLSDCGMFREKVFKKGTIEPALFGCNGEARAKQQDAIKAGEVDVNYDWLSIFSALRKRIAMVEQLELVDA